MNAIVLGIPIILVRYGLLSIVNKEALARAAFFPPVQGREKTAFAVYQVTTLFLLIAPAFFRIHLATILNCLGGFLFLAGLALYVLAILDFARPQAGGVNKNGLYRYSRNPMYVAFFLYFLGCSLLIISWLYLGVLLVFQVSVHYLTLSEERWCLAHLPDYGSYMNTVRRYM